MGDQLSHKRAMSRLMSTFDLLDPSIYSPCVSDEPILCTLRSTNKKKHISELHNKIRGISTLLRPNRRNLNGFFHFLNENLRQSTHPTGSISLLSWRLSGLLFDNIIADRTGVIHDIQSSHTDPMMFGVYFFSFD